MNLVISRCCFVEDGKEMYKNLYRTCRVIVLLIKPFVLWRSRQPSPSCLLKFPNSVGGGANVNFQNLNNARFWHSSTDVCIITDAVTTKLKGNVLVTPPLYIPYFFGWLPFEPIFFGVPPSLKSHQHPYLIKNERSLNWSNFNVVYVFIYLFIDLLIYLLFI